MCIEDNLDKEEIPNHIDYFYNVETININKEKFCFQLVLYNN